MKFKSILKNHKQFESAVEDIIQYAQEIIADLPYKSPISSKEKHILLEALILKICALWEKFIEAEIIYATCFNTKKLSQVMGLNHMTKLNPKLVRAIIFSDTYRSFQDIDYLVYFSKKVIENKYNPFIRIRPYQKKNILFTYKIRNYLSHYSEYSKRALFSDYKKSYNYKKFLEPGKFLLKNKGEHYADLAKNFKITSIYMRKIFK
ncbi:MAG: hypothetical protein E3J52_07665 [Promethearchaeota archaeon]|nr:MAG: hypothetical protein E3J52_07665 [Candidatus Lokiarchaeota archaeon]